jgi:hypothetical protein
MRRSGHGGTPHRVTLTATRAGALCETGSCGDVLLTMTHSSFRGQGERARRHQRAAVELQRQRLVTTAVVHEQASGWPSTVPDLTSRRFDVGRGQNHLATAELFIGVVLEASAGDLARTFRWPVGKARGHLDALAAAARVTRSGNRYLAYSVAGQFR